MREAGIDDGVAQFWRTWMDALRNTQPRLLAYLSYMVERLIWMKGILKPTGTIYLHCDPTCGHYIKVMMDSVLGHDNFRNEIIWSYRRWPVSNNDFQRMHDLLFRYSKGKNPSWNQLYEPLSDATIKRFGKKKQVADFTTGKRLPRQVEKPTPGAPMRDVWEIPIIAPSAKERMGYDTQKPLKLLNRIIEASTNEGDVVLDPFCGCATTLEAAHKLKRRWIGIDIAIHAIKRVSAVRLQERLGLAEGQDYEIEGIPENLEGAQDLWRRDKYHFQEWAVEQVGGFVTKKQTADGGIDGRIYFETKIDGPLESMIIEVKGGKTVNIEALRALRGVLDDGDALLAGLIIMEPLNTTKARNFDRFMASAGDLEVGRRTYSKMQILSVKEILSGATFKTPDILGRQESGQGQMDLAPAR